MPAVLDTHVGLDQHASRLSSDFHQAGKDLTFHATTRNTDLSIRRGGIEVVRRTEAQLISTVLLISWLGTGDGGEEVSISAAEPSSMLVLIDPFDPAEKGDS